MGLFCNIGKKLSKENLHRIARPSGKWQPWIDWFCSKINLLSNIIGPKGPLQKGHFAYYWINDNAGYDKTILY